MASKARLRGPLRPRGRIVSRVGPPPPEIESPRGEPLAVISQLTGIQHRPSGGSGSVNSFGSSAHAVQTGMSSGMGTSGSALRTALSRCPSPAIVSAVTTNDQSTLSGPTCEYPTYLTALADERPRRRTRAGGCPRASSSPTSKLHSPVPQSTGLVVLTQIRRKGQRRGCGPNAGCRGDRRLGPGAGG